MRGAGSHLLIAFLVAFLVRGPVHAGPLKLTPEVYAGKGGTRVLVVVAPLDARAKSLQGLIEHAVEGAVDSSDRFDVIRGVDAFDGSAARARYDKANEAQTKATEGKKALEDLDSAAATKLYAEAVAAWKQADLTKGIDGLIEAQVGKAAGHSVSEENPAAKQEIERALVLAPKTKLSDAQFPPELLKFAESRRAAFRTAKGKLTVRTEPPGACVWVDGSYRGASPVTAEQLASGEKHLVVAALSGYSMEAVEVGTGDQLVKLRNAEQSFQLQSALDRIAKDPEGPGRDAAARELGSAAMADQVLLVVVKRGATDKLDATAVRLDVKDGHNFAYQSGALPEVPKGISEWAGALLASDTPRDGKRPVGNFAGGKGGGGGPSTARQLGIGLIAGSLVAGASWGVFGYSALQQATFYKNTPQVEAPKSSQAVSSGKTFALIADISWAVGAVLLVMGVLVAFTPLFGGAGGGSSSGGSRSSSSGQAKPKEDDAMKAYREHQEEQRRLDEERAQKAKEAPPAEEKKPEEKKAEEKKPEEKKPEEKTESAPPAEEKKKKLTPAEEKAEKKRKAEEEKAEKKKQAEEAKKKAADEKAEKKRKAEEEKAEKKKQAEEAKKKAADEKAEQKRKAEEEKQKSAEEKKRAAEEKKDEGKRPPEDDKQKKADEEKRLKEEEQKKADEAEAKRIDEARRKKEEEEKKKQEDEAKERGEQEPPKREERKLEDDDLRNF